MSRVEVNGLIMMQKISLMSSKSVELLSYKKSRRKMLKTKTRKIINRSLRQKNKRKKTCLQPSDSYRKFNKDNMVVTTHNIWSFMYQQCMMLKLLNQRMGSLQYWGYLQLLLRAYMHSTKRKMKSFLKSWMSMPIILRSMKVIQTLW